MLENGEGRSPEQEGSPQLVYGGYSREEVYKLGKENLNFFAALCLPTIFTFFFPAIHLAVWDLICQKAVLLQDFSKLALGLPRGHAKTTLIKLFVVWLILFTDRQFILIVCSNTDPLAQSFLSDVCDILDSPNIKNTFGDWRANIEQDTQTLKKFSFLGRDIILAATGKGAVRGLNIKHRRPDVIVMDDMQTREDSESPTQADKDLTWMFATLMKLKDPKRCLYIYIGNMYHSPGCILRKLKKNKNWISFIVGAILNDGKPIWPELHSIESLMAEFENDVSVGKPEIFFSEVMNDPEAGVSSILDINKIPISPYVDATMCNGRFIIIDVALDKFQSDDTTIAQYGLYGQDIVMEKLEFGSFNPRDTIVTALMLALASGATVIVVEDVAYQASLLFWFDIVATEFKITGIEFVPITPGGIPKNSRILQWFKRILPSKDSTGTLDPPREYIGSEVRSAVLWEASQFKPTTKNNVDNILDNAAYASKVVELYAPFIAIPALSLDVDSGAKVVENNSAF
jgi:hypothetical protein